MKHEITANFDTLMRQAGATVEVYLRDAIKMLKENELKPDPVLISSIINAASKDFENSMAFIVKSKQADAMNNIAQALMEMSKDANT